MNHAPVRQSRTSVGAAARKRCAAFLSLLLFVLALSTALAGCSVMWVSSYDKSAVGRLEEISKSTLKFYQDLLGIESPRRREAALSSLKTSQGDIETQMRIHVLREQARADNPDSTRVAENLLRSWREFAALRASGRVDAFNDAVLESQRTQIERHLKAAFVAEEAKKKPGSGASGATGSD